MDKLTLTQPDDMHLHLRDGALLERTVADAAKQFARAIVMPNLRPCLSTPQAVIAYRERILAMRPAGSQFQPLMTLYLTDKTTAQDIHSAKQANIVACKLYPAGATTNANSGVTRIEHCYPAFEQMQTLQMPLLIHGEVNDPAVDIFDREKKFVDTHLTKIIEQFPRLPIVLEHITTEHAVRAVQAAHKQVAATITAHHLYINRTDMLAGGIKPHLYCLPVAKRDRDRQALVNAATSGNPKFFLGTDSAPHTQSAKESACGCAGIYTAHAAIELYAQVFEACNALDKLNAFASQFGAAFYGLAPNTQRIVLEKKPQHIPKRLVFGDDFLIPFKADETLSWQLKVAKSSQVS